MRVPHVVRNKASAVGAEQWLAGLPDLVASVARDWSLRVGRMYEDATEAFVAEATREDGTPAVLKLVIPREGADADHEITALKLTNGRGCARLLRDDVGRGALLLERLGTPLHRLGLPIGRRHEILCAAAEQVWRPAPACGLPTGADKGRRLTDFITATWEELGRPCAERTVEHRGPAPPGPVAGPPLRPGRHRDLGVGCRRTPGDGPAGHRNRPAAGRRRDAGRRRPRGHSGLITPVR
jgi:streptomycin 6-kinase